MRIPRGAWFRIALLLVFALLAGLHFGRRFLRPSRPSAIPDRARTSPLNQPGGGPAPAPAYSIYSDLYQEPAGEPLVFSNDSVTDIPQVNGSCLKPTSPEEREMVAAFEEANSRTHRWEARFTIPAGYQLISRGEASAIQTCLDRHNPGSAACEKYSQIRHVRFLGVPGVNRAGTRALVSVVRMCGSYCGSGGIFAVEKSGAAWRRSETTGFTRECSWMY